MNLTDHVKVPMSFCRLKTKSKPFGLLRPQFTTIAKFQWFSKAPSPLNGMVRVKPLGSMVFRWFWCQATIGFNGCPPLIRRWNGYIPSLKSIPNCRSSSLLPHRSCSAFSSFPPNNNFSLACLEDWLLRNTGEEGGLDFFLFRLPLCWVEYSSDLSTSSSSQSNCSISSSSNFLFLSLTLSLVLFRP